MGPCSHAGGPAMPESHSRPCRTLSMMYCIHWATFKTGWILAVLYFTNRSHPKWYLLALQGIQEPNAMALATSSSSQQPSARMVLLKGYDERGFSFYTNYDSRKGRELAAVGKAALCFFWEPLQRSVSMGAMALPGMTQGSLYPSARLGLFFDVIALVTI